MRTLKFDNKKVLTLLKENETLSKEINKIVEEWQEKDQYVKKLSMKMERIKEKIRPIVATLIKKETELGEFEIVESTKLSGDKVVVNIVDQIELIKENLRKQKANNLPEDAKD